MKYQIVYFISAILSIPFFPILLILGNMAKSKTGKLPEAIGPSGKVIGKEPEIRLAVVGESTVAGVGVKDHSEGVTGQLAYWLKFKTGKAVKWEAIGASGYTARKVYEHLAGQVKERLSNPDIIVIMLGGNDTFELNSPMKWRRDMSVLIKQLGDEHPDTLLLIANLPPVDRFTSFSPVLHWYMGSLTNLHRKVIMDFPSLHQNLVYMSQKIDFDLWRKEEGRDVPMEEFFSDGVHPSALTYYLWSKQIAEEIVLWFEERNQQSI